MLNRSLIALFVVAALFFAGVQANDRDEDKKVTERKLKFQVEGTKASIDAKSEGGDVEDDISFQLRTDGINGLVIDLDYEDENDRTETSLQFNVAISHIIEYKSGATHGVRAYSPDHQDDTVVSKVQLQQWGPWEKTTQTVQVSGRPVDVHVIKVATTDGMFVAKGKISEEAFRPTEVATSDPAVHAQQQSAQLSPNFVKWDFEIHGYPYQGVNTSLALQTLITSKTEFDVDAVTNPTPAKSLLSVNAKLATLKQHMLSSVSAAREELAAQKTFRTMDSDDDDDDDDKEDGVVFVGPATTPVSGVFGWVGSVDADGRNVAVKSSHKVISSSLKTGKEQDQDQEREEVLEMFFSFATEHRIQHLVWDPTVGVAYNALTAGITIMVVIVVVVVVGVLVIIGVLALNFLRQRSARFAKERQPFVHNHAYTPVNN